MPKTVRDNHADPCRQVRLAGSVLVERPHVCAFFHSREQEYRVLLPFIKDGFDCGDRAVHLVGSARQDEHLEQLISAGIDTETMRRTHQLELRDWKDSYLVGEYFDPDRWFSLLSEVIAEGPRHGFKRSRLVAHMEWALDDRVGVDRLIEYEAKANFLWPPHKESAVIAVCAYDLSKFGANVIVDVMRTHPMVIIGGILHRNPFYVEPNTFLDEVRERQTKRPMASEAGL
jgi:DcmR-like sensory protein